VTARQGKRKMSARTYCASAPSRVSRMRAGEHQALMARGRGEAEGFSGRRGKRAAVVCAAH
jgi:hypothetical protein